METTEISNKGISDIFNGMESYESAYVKGMMFDAGSISFKQMTGTEGFVDSVMKKTEQFFKWLWDKLKSVSAFLFGTTKKAYGQDAIDLDDKSYKLKDTAAAEMGKELKACVDMLKKGKEVFLKELGRVIGEEYKDLDLSKARKNVVASNTGGYDRIDSFINRMELRIATFDNHPNFKQFGTSVVGFLNIFNELATYLKKNLPHHKAEYNADYSAKTPKDKAWAEIKKDLSTIPEDMQEKCCNWLMRLLNTGSQFLMLNNQVNTRLWRVIDLMNSKHYYVKK